MDDPDDWHVLDVVVVDNLPLPVFDNFDLVGNERRRKIALRKFIAPYTNSNISLKSPRL